MLKVQFSAKNKQELILKLNEKHYTEASVLQNDGLQ